MDSNEFLGGCGIFYRNIWIHQLLFLVLGMNVGKNLRRKEVHLLISVAQCFGILEFF